MLGSLRVGQLDRAEHGLGDRIDVQPDLTLRSYPCVYALGDFANTPDKSGKLLFSLAAVAQQAGRHCARNIAALKTLNSSPVIRIRPV